MKRLLKLVAIVLSILIAGCGLESRVQGTGNVISENRTVSGFDSISLAGNGELAVDQNGDESLSITADDNLLQYVIAEVHGSQLELHVKSGVNMNPTKRIVYTVGTKNLTAIICAGDTTAVAKDIHTDALHLEIAGSGDISADGSADNQDITIAGSGSYNGAGVKSKSTKINIAGSGDAVIAARDSLDITIAGSGSIKYIGDPKVKQSVLGSGSVSKQ